MQEVNTDIKTILSAGLANHLAPYITPKSAFSTDATTLDDTSFDANNVQDQSLLSADKATTKQSSKELLSLPKITTIFTKSHNRHNFAALLVEHLFNVPTRMRSNVAGHDKENLDPEIIKYIKSKVFEYYE